jgi:hypothetical protein
MRKLRGGNQRGMTAIAKAKMRKCRTAGAGGGQKQLRTQCRHVIQIQRDNFTTAFQFNMGCISFFNVTSKQQFKSSLDTNAMKHRTGEN